VAVRRSVAAAIALAVLAVAAAKESSACESPPRVIRELATPRFTFPLGLAVAPDGALWVASTMSDHLVRVDPMGGTTEAHRLPLRTHPVGIALDRGGAVWFSGSGVGLVGRLAPRASRAAEFPPPALLTGARGVPTAWSLALGGPRSEVWFSMPSHGLVGRLAAGAQPTRRGSLVTEYRLDGAAPRPEGVVLDDAGGAWIADAGGDRLVHVDAAGRARPVALGTGSRPRGVARDATGAVWATLFGAGTLARVADGGVEARTWPLPAAGTARPWAVAVDAPGRVWLSDTGNDAILCFDPGRSRFTAWRVPTPRASVRALAVDLTERVWFVGAYTGRLGVVEAGSP